jgi:hypothetical protein
VDLPTFVLPSTIFPKMLLVALFDPCAIRPLLFQSYFIFCYEIRGFYTFPSFVIHVHT